MNEPITEESAEVDVVLDEQPKPWIVSDEQVLAEAQVSQLTNGLCGVMYYT